MSKLTNKIEAHDRKVCEVLENKKYTVDYFQREYNWRKKHIEQLIADLTIAFQNEYKEGDKRTDGENYNNYYLGPFVVSEKEGQRSIIDGQQRLTSLTLLLIYLNNLQKTLGIDEKIEPLIFSEHRGIKSFNLQVEERRECLERLFLTGTYTSEMMMMPQLLTCQNVTPTLSNCFQRTSKEVISPSLSIGLELIRKPMIQ